MTQTLRKLIWMAVLATVLTGCSSPDNYEVSGRIDGTGEEFIDVTVFDGRTYVGRKVQLGREGRFEVKGSAPTPVVMWLATVDHKPIASFPLVNGDRVKIDADMITAPDSVTVKGGRYAGETGNFDLSTLSMRRCHNVAEVNDAVTRYIADHPESPVSALLLVSRFHTPGSEARADSLLQLLDEQARIPAALGSYPALLSTQRSASLGDAVATMRLYDVQDTIRMYRPMASSLSMLVVDQVSDRGRDSIAAMLDRLYELLPRRRFEAVEFATDVDSMTWKVNLRDELKPWIRTWHPGHVSAPRLRDLAVPTVPFFIVCDSTGLQVLRTRSAHEAESYVRGAI